MKRSYAILWLVAVAVTLVLYAASTWFGELNQDEGWYLYAARSITKGRLPFVHFAATQGPVLPFVYVLSMPLVDRFGVLGGRLFTGVLGLLCAAAGAWLARRLAGGGRGRQAALLAFVLIGVSVYQATFFTMVKTYALAAVFLLAGFLLVSVTGRWRRTGSCLGGACLVLAAGTRSSSAVVIPIVFLGLLWQRRKQRPAEPNAAPLSLTGDPWSFLVGAVLAGAAVFLPFCLAAPRAFWFGLVEYHAARETGGTVQMLAYKAGFISRTVFAYFPAVALLLVLLVRRFWRVPHRLPSTVHCPLPLALWLSAAVVTLVHFLAPFPYDDYQVMIYPLFAVALAVELSSPKFQVFASPLRGKPPLGPACRTDVAFPIPHPSLALPLAVLLVCIAAAFSSPRNQNWLVGERDRIWWPLKAETSLRGLQRAAATVRELADRAGSDLLLTQDTYLAVEAGLDVPPGLEMGPFSYYPDWGREAAEACHVVNRELMLDLIRNGGAPVAAFSEYGLAIRSPAVARLSDEEQRELWGAVAEVYRGVEARPGFGQASTRLQILVANERLHNQAVFDR